MPGPSSPARKAKQAAAKQRASSPPPRPHYPSATSPVLKLSGTLSREELCWWNPDIGKDFLSKKKNRGDKKGAKGWLCQKFCGQWWEEHRADIDVPLEDKIWYFNKTSIGMQLYSYVNGASIRGSQGRQLPGPTALKKKSYGHDYWRRENTEVVAEAIKQWTSDKGKEPNQGEKRSIASAEFKKLPTEEQETWREKARVALETSNALAKLKDLNAREDYVSNFKKIFDGLSKEAEAVAGIKVCSMILYKKEDGHFKIDRKVSEGITFVRVDDHHRHR
ncbi:hypothetical protein BDV93DRAFT_558838 [Ceratobasidium sp. AG-I]|nr:hypothetical protein BDV93DRAFT_558838 [Ceratobasidium sp. AG-I]